MGRFTCVALALLSLAAARPSTPLGAGQDIHPDIHYVPTSNSVIDAMFKLAAVTADDVVYDLGSGDGRIPIAAARKLGARGVGVELDPALIKKSNENARKAGVSDRVRFIQGDLFQADLSDATVVMLYLSPTTNLRLAPKLQRDLRPGARVVSNRFDMGDWKPDAETKAGGRKIFLWRIRTQVSGVGIQGWAWNQTAGIELEP
jgi:SAM-dependent methyltransferase